jgi:hypothetical protein
MWVVCGISGNSIKHRRGVRGIGGGVVIWDVRDVRDRWSLVGNGGYLSLSLCFFFFASRSWFVWFRFESLKVIAGT